MLKQNKSIQLGLYLVFITGFCSTFFGYIDTYETTIKNFSKIGIGQPANALPRLKLPTLKQLESFLNVTNESIKVADGLSDLYLKFQKNRSTSDNEVNKRSDLGLYCYNNQSLILQRYFYSPTQGWLKFEILSEKWGRISAPTVNVFCYNKLSYTTKNERPFALKASVSTPILGKVTNYQFDLSALQKQPTATKYKFDLESLEKQGYRSFFVSAQNQVYGYFPKKGWVVPK
ncbi:MAG: hypothetical protein KA716_09065 [Gloeotrichia echinulata DEX184]|nr:hypothetical protein [Gloeotrichia echinulata DEX184]